MLFCPNNLFNIFVVKSGGDESKLPVQRIPEGMMLHLASACLLSDPKK